MSIDYKFTGFYTYLYTQKQYSKLHSVDEHTLCRWKRQVQIVSGL